MARPIKESLNLTKQGETATIRLSASKRELLAVFTPVRSDLLFIGNFAGRRLIQYLLAGNRPDCLTAVSSARLLLLAQKPHRKTVRRLFMPKSPLTHLNELERLVVALDAINGMLCESSKDLGNIPTVIGVLTDQMSREINNALHLVNDNTASAEMAA